MKKGAPFLLLVLLLASGYFAYTKAQDFDKRLARIEHKLGGERKIGCNEKDSIERVTKSVDSSLSQIWNIDFGYYLV